MDGSRVQWEVSKEAESFQYMEILRIKESLQSEVGCRWERQGRSWAEEKVFGNIRRWLWKQMWWSYGDCTMWNEERGL